MSTGPETQARHSTNKSNDWREWGAEATSLSESINAQWKRDQTTEKQSIIQATRFVLLDTCAVIINGLSSDLIQDYSKNNANLERGHLHFPGIQQTLSVHGLINVLSAAAPWNELVEGNAKTHGRPALHVVPISLGLGLSLQSTLDQILQAILQGYEIGSRFGEAYSVPPGEHVDGTWGTIAATVAACTLLKTTPEQTRGAINGALCQMSRSLFAPVEAGSYSRLLYSGLSAQKGLQLAIAARAELHGPSRPGRPSSDHQQRWPLAPDFTVRPKFAIEESYVKLYPGARHLHYGMDAALHWRQSHGYRAKEPLKQQDFPSTITIETYSEAIKYCNQSQPSNRIQAQFSLQYATCICLLTGDTSTNIFDQSCLQHPDLAILMSRTKLLANDHQAGRWAALNLTDQQGRSSRAESRPLKGDPGNPLSIDDRITKARRLLEDHLETGWADHLVSHWLKGDLSDGPIPDASKQNASIEEKARRD